MKSHSLVLPWGAGGVEEVEDRANTVAMEYNGSTKKPSPTEMGL